MEIRGAVMEGLRNGLAIPSDFTGLAGWWRGDLVNYNITRLALANQWKDISGNGRHFTSSNKVFQISEHPLYGYNIVKGDDGASNLSTNNSDGYWNFLTNGSPFTIIVVARSFAINGSGPQAGYGSFSTMITDYNRVDISWRKEGPVGDIASNLIIHESFLTRPSGLYYRPVGLSNRPVNLTMLSGYGNDSATPQFTVQQNDNTLITQQMNYRSPMQYGLSNLGFSIFNSSGYLNLYECVIFNQSGKTREQIDAEMYFLRNTYFADRYVNINRVNTDEAGNITSAVTKNNGTTQLAVNFTARQGSSIPGAGALLGAESAFVISYSLSYVNNGTTVNINNRTLTIPGNATTGTSDKFNISPNNSGVTSAVVTINSVTPNPNNGFSMAYQPTKSVLF